MSNGDINSSLSTADIHVSSNIPTDTDKNPIVCGDNDAHIEGALIELGLYLKRTKKHDLLLKHRAVLLKNGKIAVDSIESISFITGKYEDQRGFSIEEGGICPPTVLRIADWNKEAAKSPTSTAPFKRDDKPPDESMFIVSPAAVDVDDALFMEKLEHIFGSNDYYPDMAEEACGSGYILVKLLRARAAKASAGDKALVIAEYNKVITVGQSGNVTSNAEKFNLWIKDYKIAKRHSPARARKTDEGELEMINVIGFADEHLREVYELRCASEPPTNFLEATSIIKSILRGRTRGDQIKQINSTPVGSSLLSTKDLNKPATETPWSHEKFDYVPANKELVAALIGLGVDPKKLDKLIKEKGKGKKRDDLPRDKEGKVTKWVSGMPPCKCGIDGGKHLYRDCPAKKEPKDENDSGEANKPKAAMVAPWAPALVTFTSYARTAQGLLEIREFMHRLGKRLEEAEAAGTPVAVSSVTALGAR